MDSQCQHKISENQKSIVLKLFVTNPSTNVIGDSKISDSIARKPVNFSSTVPCTSPCTHTRMFTWLAPVRTHARSPGDGDGPRRDELLLGVAVLAVCRCLRWSPGCERRSSWAPWPCRLEKCPRERTAASCRRLIWMPGSAGLAAAFVALVLCPGRCVRRRRPLSFAGLTELCRPVAAVCRMLVPRTHVRGPSTTSRAWSSSRSAVRRRRRPSESAGGGDHQQVGDGGKSRPESSVNRRMLRCGGCHAFFLGLSFLMVEWSVIRS